MGDSSPRSRRARVVPVWAAGHDGDRLKQLIQAFIRSSGMLSADRTPCHRPLSVSHAHALMLLLESGRAGARPTQQQLGHLLGIDKSNVTRLCQKMGKVGHLVQERSPGDGRSRLLALTARGARVAATVERASRLRYQRLSAAISPEDRPRVLSALAVLNDALAVSTGPSRRDHLEAARCSPSRGSPIAATKRQGAAS